MAHEATTYIRGEMDIREQSTTFEFVMRMTKWGSLAVATLVLFLTMWLCAGAGFLAALVTAVVLASVGVFVLRERAEAH